MNASAMIWSGSMLVAAVGLALVVGWLAGHRARLARMASALVTATTVFYCSAVVFALVADNGGDVSQIKSSGLMAIAALSLTGSATFVGWTRGARARVG